MIRAAIDTHALIWYVNDDSRLSATAAGVLDDAAAAAERIAVSSMSLVEIVYLIEKQKIGATSLDALFALLDRDELLTEVSVDRAVVLAMRSITKVLVPELPDRVIAATAVRLGVPLITRDGMIRASGVATIW